MGQTMTRISKRQVVATLVVSLGVADGVGIYVAQHKLDKHTNIGPRELAVANEPLAEPIAIRTNGELKPAPALAESAVAPHASQAQTEQRTVRFAIADPVKTPVAAAAPQIAKVPATVTHPSALRTARQTAPVLTGRMAVAETPVSHRGEVRHAVAMANNTLRSEDLRVHQQRIPARSRAEHRPFQEDAFAAAFGNTEEAVRLPEPAYGRDPQPRGQASAELPPLELSTAQIHSEPTGTSDADAPLAPPPTTAAGAEDPSPKS